MTIPSLLPNFFRTLTVVIALFAASPATAQSEPPANAPSGGTLAPGAAAEFQSVIGAQVSAFRRDDWEEAFSYASPFLQQRFGDPTVFKSMVLGGYRAVAEPDIFEFRDAAVLSGRPAQVVYVVGPDGRPYRAVYFMEQQEDGSWRISGVTLLPLEGTTT